MENKSISFQYVKPTEEQISTMQHFRDEFSKLARQIEILPNSRGKALCLTNLEQSAFWLNKSITNND